MVIQSRWTLSVARGTALDAWLRRKGADDKQREAALHEWENEGGAKELPARPDSRRARAGPEG